MNSANAVVNFDLTEACDLVSQIAVTGSFPANHSIEEVREAIGRVATRLGDSFAWKTKLALAKVTLAQEIDSVAQANADRRKAEAAARAEESQRRLKEAAEKIETDRKFRHDRNLRHAQNRVERAEANRRTAKGGGAGTSQPREGKKKGGKH